jgi:hypothetical protein
MKSLAILFLSLLFISPCFAKNNPDTLSADSVIHLSEIAYANLKTYTDSGKLIQTFLTAIPRKTAVIFKTAYINTGNINFECYTVGNSNSLYTINRTDNLIKTWWGLLNKTDTPPSMSLALASAAGASGSSSAIVPELLLSAEFKNNFYRRISKRVLAGQEPVNGNDCYKITGTDRRGGSIIIWIAKKDFLIRKIETEYVVDPAKTEAMMRKMAATTPKNDSVINKKQLEAAVKTMEMALKMNSLGSKTANAAFTVKETFSFFPTVADKINPDLLKFRPNREVEL